MNNADSLNNVVSGNVHIANLTQHPINAMMYLLYRYAVANRVSKWMKVSGLTPDEFKQAIDSNPIDFILSIEFKKEEALHPESQSFIDEITKVSKHWIKKAVECYNQNPEYFSVTMGFTLNDLADDKSPSYTTFDDLYLSQDSLLLSYFSFDEYNEQMEKILNTRDENYCIYAVSRSSIINNIQPKDGYIGMLNIYEHYKGGETYDSYVVPEISNLKDEKRDAFKYDLYSSAVVLVKMFCNILDKESYMLSDTHYQIYKDFVGLHLLFNNLNTVRDLKWKVDINEISDMELIELFLNVYVDLGKQSYPYAGHGYTLFNITKLKSDVESKETRIDDICEDQYLTCKLDTSAFDQAAVVENWLNNIQDLDLDQANMNRVDNFQIIVAHPTLKPIIRRPTKDSPIEHAEVLGCHVFDNTNPKVYIKTAYELAQSTTF